MTKHLDDLVKRQLKRQMKNKQKKRKLNSNGFTVAEVVEETTSSTNNNGFEEIVEQSNKSIIIFDLIIFINILSFRNKGKFKGNEQN